MFDHRPTSIQADNRHYRNQKLKLALAALLAVPGYIMFGMGMWLLFGSPWFSIAVLLASVFMIYPWAWFILESPLATHGQHFYMNLYKLRAILSRVAQGAFGVLGLIYEPSLENPFPAPGSDLEPLFLGVAAFYLIVVSLILPQTVMMMKAVDRVKRRELSERYNIISE